MMRGCVCVVRERTCYECVCVNGCVSVYLCGRKSLFVTKDLSCGFKVRMSRTYTRRGFDTRLLFRVNVTKGFGWYDMT